MAAGGDAAGGLKAWTYEEVSKACQGFDQGLLLGEGGFGRVYRGQLGGQPVAVKVSTHKPFSSLVFVLPPPLQFQPGVRLLPKISLSSLDPF